MTTMVQTCKHCGAVLPQPGDNLSPTMRRIYDFVARRPGTTMDEIFNHLYGDQASGGPESTNIVTIMISQINKRISNHRLSADRRGPGATYRLVKETKE